MPVIVDGYNVLFAIARYGGRPISAVIEEARERLLSRLVAYHQATGLGVTVVFDSRRARGGARQDETVQGVRVVYSHPPRTADDEIFLLVKTSGDPRTILVATSDRKLADACTGEGAASIGAIAFYRELEDVCIEADEDDAEQRLKEQVPSDAEVRELLEAFGEDDTPQPDNGLDWDEWLR